MRQRTQTLTVTHTAGESNRKTIYTPYDGSTLGQIVQTTVDTQTTGELSLTGHIVPELTPYREGICTNWFMHPNGTVIASEGNGNIDIDINKVIPVRNTTQFPAYWDISLKEDNLTWDYSSLVYNPSGNGLYNIFTLEVSLTQFIVALNTIGAVFTTINSDIPIYVGPGSRFRLDFETHDNHCEWESNLSIIIQKEY